MSTTPRTDRAEHFGLTSDECVLVHEDDMKKLELELAQLEQDHATTLRLHHEDKKKLETELIATKDELTNFQRSVCEQGEVIEQLKTELITLQKNYESTGRVVLARDSTIASLQEERDQLLATVEGLRAIISEIKHENSLTYREATEIGYSDGMWIKPSIALKIDQTLQFLPPTNLVKRSVLEKCYKALSGYKEFSGEDSNFPLEQCDEALKEAHEELQRTAK